MVLKTRFVAPFILPDILRGLGQRPNWPTRPNLDTKTTKQGLAPMPS